LNKTNKNAINILSTMIAEHNLNERFMAYAGLEEELMINDEEHHTDTAGKFIDAAAELFEHTNATLMSNLRSVKHSLGELLLVVLDNKIVVCDHDSYERQNLAHSEHFITLIII